MTNNDSIFETLAQDINSSNLSEQDKQKMLGNLAKMRSSQINLIITGATGCGKSSTINAMFNSNMATVGESADPETMSISKYEYGNLILWDSPGLGDGRENDIRHSKNIIDKLKERDSDGNMLIDLVLVILDGGSRDLGTSYELINSVIIPNLGPDKDKRIIVAINQADMAMKGKYWNYEEHRPEPKLEQFLNEKTESVKKRIYEATGVSVEPIYYSAGYTENGEQEPPYNLSKLFLEILRHTPEKKRIIYVDNVNCERQMWENNDNVQEYNKEIRRSLGESVARGVVEGSSVGGDIGESLGGIFGRHGAAVGKAIGTVVGGVFGAIGGFFEGLFG